MNEKKARFLRQLLVVKAIKQQVPYPESIHQASNIRGIINDDDYSLKLKSLKMLWYRATKNEKKFFVSLIINGGNKK